MHYNRIMQIKKEIQPWPLGANAGQFLAYLRNKNVCVVGPSPDLVGSGSGQLLDNFDITVRTNSSFLLPDSYHNDYGSKTDILYINNFYVVNEVFKDRKGISFFKQLEKNKVKFVVIKGKKAAATLDKLAIRYKCNTKFVGTSYKWIRHARFWRKNKVKEFNWKKKYTNFYEPTMSTFILSDLMESSVGNIYITGINFYNSTKHWAPFYNKNVNQQVHAVGRLKTHNILADKKYLQYHWKKFPDIIHVDPILANLL